jgi:hypothetical protein
MGIGLRLSEYDDNQSDAGVGGTLRFLAKTSDNEPPMVTPPWLIESTFDLDTLLTPTS